MIGIIYNEQVFAKSHGVLFSVIGAMIKGTSNIIRYDKIQHDLGWREHCMKNLSKHEKVAGVLFTSPIILVHFDELAISGIGFQALSTPWVKGTNI